MKKTVNVAVTGAAGQISYSLLFQIASGAMLGHDQPISLRCLEITPAMKALEGVVMELKDCAFPLLAEIIATDKPEEAYDNVDFVLLVGARPRGPGMERGDLLEANGNIFTVQGKALNDHASRDVKVVAVGNPANTNAYITMKSAPDLNPKNFTALTRLDHNRAYSQLAEKTGAKVTDIKQLSIWGNHSATQYPDVFHATVNGKEVRDLVDEQWLKDFFIPTVAKRGAAIIDARGQSSAASAAKAVVDHIHDWALGTADGNWTSMAVCSDGSYGVEKDIIYSFPVVCKNGDYEIVQGLEINSFSQAYMDKTAKELIEERDIVQKLLS